MNFINKVEAKLKNFFHHFFKKNLEFHQSTLKKAANFIDQIEKQIPILVSEKIHKFHHSLIEKQHKFLQSVIEKHHQFHQSDNNHLILNSYWKKKSSINQQKITIFIIKTVKQTNKTHLSNQLQKNHKTHESWKFFAYNKNCNEVFTVFDLPPSICIMLEFMFFN